MKNLIISIIFTASFLFSQTPVMQRIESLHTVEAYPVGKIVSINGLGDIFAVNSGNSEVYVLKNGSNTWSKILSYCGTVSGIYNSSDNAVFIKTSNGLYYSSNTSTYSPAQILVETTAFSVAENSSGTIFCGTTDGLYKSDNNGTSWSITYEYPLKMAVSSTDVMYIDEYNKGLCRSTDLGVTWEEINYNLPKDSVISDIQVTTDGTVFISVMNNGMYKLSGTEWVTQGFNYTSVNSIHAGKNGYMYCSLGDKIYKKTTSASFWTEIKSTQGRITSFSSNANKLIAGYTDDLLIFESLDWGTTWTTNGQIIFPSVLSVLTLRNYIFAGTDDGIYTSSDYGATWSAKQLSFPVNDIELERYERIAIGTDDGLYRSSDYGATWVKRTGYPTRRINKILFKDYTYYVAGYGFQKSTDYGATWTLVYSEMSSPDDVAKLDTGRIYLADYWPGVWYSDNETEWIDTGLGNRAVDIESNSIGEVYANVNNTILKLPFAGAEWSTCLSASFYSLYIDSDDIVFAGATSSIKYSLFGSNWDVIYGTPSDSQVNDISRDSDGYLVCGTGKGLYKSNLPISVTK
jgi:photosystem II stability/assembly factor-like uncharacterized protein